MPTIFSNPRGPKPTQPLGASENIQNPLGTGYLIPWDGGAKIVRAPLITRIFRVVAFTALVSQAPVNLLANTLSGGGPPPPAPFKQTEWSNPVVKKADVTNRTWLLNLLQSTLTPAAPAQPPFYQTNWPNPTQKKPDIRGSTASVNLNIIGKDQFYGAAGQAPTYDYPNPKTARRGPPDQSQSLLQSTLAPVVVAGNPFSQSNWPNPIRRHAQRLGNFYHRIGTATGAGAAPPLANTPWVNPLVKPNREAERSQLPRNTLAMVEDFVAFSAMQDTPNRVSRVHVDAQQSGVKPQFIQVQAAPPFVPVDFPNPTLRKPLALTWTQNLATLNLTGDKPFPNYDFPNPQRPGPRQYWLFCEVQFIPAPVVQAPFYQTDWPTPQPRRVILPTPSWLDAGLSYRGGGNKPFTNYDHPNPQPKRRIRQDLALQLNLPIITPPPVVAGGTHHKRKWRRSG